MSDSKALAVSPVTALIKSKQSVLSDLLPQGTLEFNQFAAAVNASVGRDPHLMNAFKSNPSSFFAAVTKAAAMGLEPGDTLGHFYLVPFKNNKSNKTDTVAVVGYKGLLEMARRHPSVVKINVHCVYEGEVFEYDRATDEVHHPLDWEKLDSPDNKLLGVYVIAILAKGNSRETVVHLVSRAKIEELRKRSPSGNKGPWKTDYIAMAMKAAIRQAVNRGKIPISSRDQAALRADEVVEEEDEEVKVTSVTVTGPDPVDYDEIPQLPEPPAEEPEAEPEDQHLPEGIELMREIQQSLELLGVPSAKRFEYCADRVDLGEIANIGQCRLAQLREIAGVLRKEIEPAEAQEQ